MSTISSFIAAVQLTAPTELLMAVFSTVLLVGITFYFVHHKRQTHPK